MHVKLFEAVRTTVNQVIETAHRVSVEDEVKYLTNLINRLERQFQTAVQAQSLPECKELRNQINSAKTALKAL
jgi:hypothetical protein